MFSLLFDARATITSAPVFQAFPAQMSAAQNPLSELRRQIDEIDTALHDLIMRRTEVVQEIAAVKGRTNGAAFHLPGREAEVIRRLVRRHKGPFPKPALVRIWREMISALIRLQGPFAVAVYAPDDRLAYWDLARDHYGALTPIVAHASTGQVVSAVTEGAAAIGVLPMPEQRGTKHAPAATFRREVSFDVSEAGRGSGKAVDEDERSHGPPSAPISANACSSSARTRTRLRLALSGATLTSIRLTPGRAWAASRAACSSGRLAALA